MLRITAISAGAVEYLIGGSGCTHEHDAAVVDLDAGLDSAGGAEAGAAQGVDGAAGYFASAVRSGEVPGRWAGSGLAMVGVQPGQVADPEAVRAVFGRVEHPVSGQALGRAPRRFKTYRQRLAASMTREPLPPSPERLAALELAAKTDGRKAVAYYDFTFSPVKSVSVYYAALLAEGFLAEAELVVAAHRDAVDIAMAYAESHVAYVRVGYHGRTAEGRSVGRYEAATGLVMTVWEHSTNREGEPQLYTHVAVSNRAVTRSDGQIRAIDGRGFRPIKEAVAAAYDGALEQLVGESVGVVFGTRPDGIAREILGVDPGVCAEASTRRAQVLARLDELTADYVARHGRAPDAGARKALSQAATLDTRAAKTGQAGPAAVLAWARQRPQAMADTVDGVADAANRVAVDGHPDTAAMTAMAAVSATDDRSTVLAAAVAEVQARYATWTIGNLIAALDRHLPALDLPAQQRPHLLEAMAKQAVSADNEYGVLQLTAADPVAVPAELRRPEDGRLVFRAHIDERYATTAQLATETRIVAAARATTAPAITGPDLELLRVELAAAGLGSDQVAAVAGIVSSGRAGDVLIGPAGAGKSRTVAALASVWQHQFGGRVLGLATSQRAADVLAEDGLPSLNIAAFLHRHQSDARPGSGEVGVRAGDLFVIDEVSMTSTVELDRIVEIVRRGGGKVVFTGDPYQLAAIGAGGLLALLVADNGAFELHDIRRFDAGWEGPASAGLRVGDVSVLAEYEDRGRLQGGTVEDMAAAAVRGYLADIVTGRESLLIVGTNQQAAELNRSIRRELITLGRVDPAPLAQLRDGTQVSAGDLVQARRNDSHIPVHDGVARQSRRHVVNRETYRVLGRTPDGGLLVDGVGVGVGAVGVGAVGVGVSVAQLPAGYVRGWLTLAYASTVHAAQGRTVDTAHALLGEQAHCEDAYVALTRGRERNTAYLTTRRAADEHAPERLAETVVGRMAGILERVGDARSAEWERRVGDREGRSLAWIGAVFDQTSADTARARYTDTLAHLLPAEMVQRVVAEPGFPRLLRAIRDAELAGHHPDALLSAAIAAGGSTLSDHTIGDHAVEGHGFGAGRGLGESGSVADVLRWRIRFHTRDRVPEQIVDPREWTTWSPPVDGPVGQFLHELAVLATDRQADIGHTAAAQQPVWATNHLGTPPDDPDECLEWERRAAAVGAYRELAGIDDAQASLGAAPSPEQVLHRALWRHATRALGVPAEEIEFRSAPDVVLYEHVAAWERAQAWAPAYVADQLRDAHQVAETSRRDAVLGAAEQAVTTATDLAPDAPSPADAVQTTAQTADTATLRAGELERTYRDRAAWAETTAAIEQRARLAAEELTRRDLPVAASGSGDEQNTPSADAESDESAASGTGGRVDDAGREPPTAQPGTAAGAGGHESSPGAGPDRTTQEGYRGRGPAGTAADIARIQQDTRDTLAGIRSRARDAALQRLRGEATASVQRWRDRRIDHADAHELTPDPDAGLGRGLDRDISSHEVGIDLD